MSKRISIIHKVSVLVRLLEKLTCLKYKGIRIQNLVPVKDFGLILLGFHFRLAFCSLIKKRIAREVVEGLVLPFFKTF